MTYVPYETLSKTEAEEISLHLPTSLRELGPEQLVALKELLADSYARGLETGFSLSDFAGDTPGEIMDAYNAGIAEGRK